MKLPSALPVPLMGWSPSSDERLHVGRQRVGDVAEDRVGAFAEALADHVARVIDVVACRCRAAGHGVGAGTAVRRVVAGQAGEGVVAIAADEVSLPACRREVDASAGGHRRGGRGEHRLGRALAGRCSSAQRAGSARPGRCPRSRWAVAPLLLAPGCRSRWLGARCWPRTATATGRCWLRADRPGRASEFRLAPTLPPAAGRQVAQCDGRRWVHR